MARSINFDRVIETGTYRGTSTEFFDLIFGVPVASVEASSRYFVYSQRRFAGNDNVTVEFGDSRAFLQGMVERLDLDETVFFYLDAHWEEELPLAEEIEIIASAWSRAVVMIDDFRVPNDSGYYFDDYGPGKALIEDYLPARVLAGWKLYYPMASSESETGAKRGSCVLLSSSLAGEMETLALRPARVW